MNIRIVPRIIGETFACTHHLLVMLVTFVVHALFGAFLLWMCLYQKKQQEQELLNQKQSRQSTIRADCKKPLTRCSNDNCQACTDIIGRSIPDYINPDLYYRICHNEFIRPLYAQELLYFYSLICDTKYHCNNNDKIHRNNEERILFSIFKFLKRYSIFVSRYPTLCTTVLLEAVKGNSDNDMSLKKGFLRILFSKSWTSFKIANNFVNHLLEKMIDENSNNTISELFQLKLKTMYDGQFNCMFLKKGENWFHTRNHQTEGELYVIKHLKSRYLYITHRQGGGLEFPTLELAIKKLSNLNKSKTPIITNVDKMGICFGIPFAELGKTYKIRVLKKHTSNIKNGKDILNNLGYEVTERGMLYQTAYLITRLVSD
jgi:hypothetical protein